MTFLDKIYKHLPDADDLFAYDTVKQVRVLDRRLGLIYYTVLNCILFYILIYVFMIEKKYQDGEKSNGWVTTQIRNSPKPIGNNLPFDIFDIAHAPGEQGSVFIPTRVLVTRGQQNKNTNSDADFCSAPMNQCSLPHDCEIEDNTLQKGNQCNNGFCHRRQWCPAECDPSSVVGDPFPCSSGATEAYDIPPEDYGNYELRFSSSVYFHKFALDVTTAEEKTDVRYPKAKANTYRVKDLLRMANIDLNGIQINGAVLLVNLLFDCELDDELCTSSAEALNVDSKFGFNFAKTVYYTEGGVEKRDLYRFFGIRIATFATGMGAKISFSQIVLQISSAIALLAVAGTAADFFLQYVVPERKHYQAQKIIETNDLED